LIATAATLVVNSPASAADPQEILALLKAVPVLSKIGNTTPPKETRDFTTSKISLGKRYHDCWAMLYSAKFEDLDFTAAFVDEQKAFPGYAMLAIPCKDKAECNSLSMGSHTVLTRTCKRPPEAMKESKTRGLSFGLAKSADMKAQIEKLVAAAKR